MSQQASQLCLALSNDAYLRVSSLSASEAGFLYTAGAMQRLFFGVSCGQDHVAAEASRLLLRLFAPAAGRSGAPPWNLPKADGACVRGEPVNNVEDSAIAQQAKMTALRQPGRSAPVKHLWALKLDWSLMNLNFASITSLRHLISILMAVYPLK